MGIPEQKRKISVKKYSNMKGTKQKTRTWTKNKLEYEIMNENSR